MIFLSVSGNLVLFAAAPVAVEVGSCKTSCSGIALSLGSWLLAKATRVQISPR